jgi:hypothetical protein
MLFLICLEVDCCCDDVVDCCDRGQFFKSHRWYAHLNLNLYLPFASPKGQTNKANPWQWVKNAIVSPLRRLSGEKINFCCAQQVHATGQFKFFYVHLQVPNAGCSLRTLHITPVQGRFSCCQMQFF